MSSPAGEAVVFPTCLVEQLRPQLAAACKALVAAADGAAPRSAHGGACCGQPAWNAGFTSAARRVAGATLRTLRRTNGPIVVPSGSCATMMQRHWPEVFFGTSHEAEARAVAERVVELAMYLDARSPHDAAPSAGATTVTVHDSCHGLRELGVKAQPRRLLAEQGVAVVESEGAERCCGFGGTFCVKLPAVSVAMADDRLDEWTTSGVQTIVGGDLSCLVHLEGRARRRSLPLRFCHLAEVLRPSGDASASS